MLRLIRGVTPVTRSYRPWLVTTNRETRLQSLRRDPCFAQLKSKRQLSQALSIMGSKGSKQSTPVQDTLFCYDSARWLWDEEKQLRERYRPFNVEKLKQVAAEALGASKCVSIEKLNEGNFNKALRLVMDNNALAIARIPNPNAGPAFLTTASEVATIDFVSVSRLGGQEIAPLTTQRHVRYWAYLFHES